MSEPVTFSGGGQSEFAGQSFVVRQIAGRSLAFWLQAAEIRTTATLILDDGRTKSFGQRQDLPAKSDQRVLDGCRPAAIWKPLVSFVLATLKAVR